MGQRKNGKPGLVVKKTPLTLAHKRRHLRTMPSSSTNKRTSNTSKKAAESNPENILMNPISPLANDNDNGGVTSPSDNTSLQLSARDIDRLVTPKIMKVDASGFCIKFKGTLYDKMKRTCDKYNEFAPRYRTLSKNYQDLEAHNDKTEEELKALKEEHNFLYDKYMEACEILKKKGVVMDHEINNELKIHVLKFCKRHLYRKIKFIDNYAHETSVVPKVMKNIPVNLKKMGINAKEFQRIYGQFISKGLAASRQSNQAGMRKCSTGMFSCLIFCVSLHDFIFT